MNTIFDSNSKPLITAEALKDKLDSFPDVVISCFSKKLFDLFLETVPHKQIGQTNCASQEFPLYEIEVQGKRIGLYCSPVGAPACVSVYEDFCAMGLNKLILFGTCGVLDQTIDDCSIVVPTSSIREEGTSFHYVPASLEIEASNAFIPDFLSYLSSKDIHYKTGKNWTTDAPYRETIDKVSHFKSLGVISVDMEASAMAAVAQFKNKKILHFFYAADSLAIEKWDKRSLSNSARLDDKLKIFNLVIDYILTSKMM